MPAVRDPEILAPAGSPACLPAAVAGGATAVYLGLRHFNARGRAENFRKDDLPGHVAYLHHHGLKCYVVLNTLVHDDEHAKALDLAAAAHHAGVDAVIVQDLGLWSLLGTHLPQLARHASTQMTIHHPSQIEALAELGAERVILARELSLDELRVASDCAHAHGMDIEHFVHGALCYALSGQCLMSNFAGCRSANRGTCAQNCRFVYNSEDGAAPDTLLSMRDLSLVERVGDLCAAGVASFKIEGRLKGPDYVYTVSRAFSQAVAAWQAGALSDAEARNTALRTVFARPFTDTPLDGDYSAAARLRRDAADECSDGQLLSLSRARGEACFTAAVEPEVGQGYTFTSQGYRSGFQIRAVERDGPGRYRCRVRVDRRGPTVPAGTSLRRNSDPRRLQETRQAMAAVPLERGPSPGPALDAELRVSPGEAPELRFTQGGQLLLSVRGSDPAQVAQARPLDEAALRAALGTLEGSGYRLAAVRLLASAPSFVPAGQLKALRRSACAQLSPPAAPDLVFAAPEQRRPRPRSTALWVAVGSIAAARAALAAGADQVWLDDPHLDLWAAQPPALPDLGEFAGRLAIRHPAAAPLSPHLAALGVAVVAGHVGVLRHCRDAGIPVIADVTCNATSSVTVATLGRLGAQAVVLSLECSAREIARLVGRLHDPDLPQVAVVVQGRVPAMLTRQDHGLAPGEQRQIRASDGEGGLPYTIQRAHGGWTAIWEARQLSAPEHAQRTAGLVDGWVLELADCEPAVVAAMTKAYGQLRAGSVDAAAVAALCAAHAPYGIFPGHLDIGSRALDAVIVDPEADEDAAEYLSTQQQGEDV